MESAYKPQEHEGKIYEFWEKQDLLKAPKDGKPFTILMPPPNANASLHAGHGMYTVEDILIRYKRLTGYSSLWIPGIDHAGFETQFVYEKHLKKQGKSRFDFDRKTLYEDMWKFVKENSGLIYKQFKRLGFLADWERSVYTLDDNVLQRVFETFKKMFDEGKIYRANYIVNYCIRCGTSLSELETEHVERIDPLYYIDYGSVTVATVRPETIFGDVAVAVNPKDKKYKHLIGETAILPLLNTQIPIIADEFVDPKFGTGAVKVTPAHDPADFEIGKRHGLEQKQIINFLTGRLNEQTPYSGLKIKEARIQVVEDLQKAGLIKKVKKDYLHSVGVCYKTGNDLEPTIIPNWFVKVEDLKKPVIEVVKRDRIKFFPKRFKKQMLDWLDQMHDWPISRQIVWGIRIPAYFCKAVNSTPEVEEERSDGKTSGVNGNSWFVSVEKPSKCQICGECKFEQDPDTFDTWFSSGQWPLVTLKDSENDRLPTDFMGTLQDILRFWISRMIMFSLYLKDEIPFKDVYLWPMVADSKGVKMSKSKGNVVNPLVLIDKYGADAFRASLLFGVGEGGKIILAEEKMIGMRNFTNKVWNIGRFIYLNKQNAGSTAPVEEQSGKTGAVYELANEFQKLKKQYIKDMDAYKFSHALGAVYEFLWHRFADYYIEELKDELKNGNIDVYRALEHVYLENLKLLHPFMPFVTESVYKALAGETESILNVRL